MEYAVLAAFISDVVLPIQANDFPKILDRIGCIWEKLECLVGEAADEDDDPQVQQAGGQTRSNCPKPCKLKFRQDNPRAMDELRERCPKFVSGFGKNSGECQDNAKLTAPRECREFYAHIRFPFCGKVP